MVVMEIDENKSSGPDGFNFFKKKRILVPF